MRIKDTAKDIYRNSVDKGFYEISTEVGTRLMLVTSELGEALEADRKDRHHTINPRLILDIEDDDEFVSIFRDGVKDSFSDEIADAVIRLFDLSEHYNIDLEAHIAAKMRYNSTREYKHGKKY
jgi:NTP pyrophosphatase (non-canonical NTP hydrolase)